VIWQSIFSFIDQIDEAFEMQKRAHVIRHFETFSQFSQMSNTKIFTLPSTQQDVVIQALSIFQ
jgi:hypothetical protein